jgi:ribosome recycling factor
LRELLLLLVQAREDFDVRVMQLTKQRREGVMKAKTGRGGETRYEARLNSKKHRTTSRRKMKQQGAWSDEDDEDFDRDV